MKKFMSFMVAAGMVALSASPLYAKPVNCDTPKGDLQDAIDKANIGAELQLRGTCEGPFFITKNISLVGPATLTAPGSFTVLSVQDGGHATLRNLYINAVDAGEGLGVSQASSANLNNVVVENSSGNGINVRESSSINICCESRVENSSGSGIHVAFVSHANISHTYLIENRDGLFITEAASAGVHTSLFQENTDSGIILFAGSTIFARDIEIRENEGAGLHVDRLSHASLFESLIIDNEEAGVRAASHYSFLQLRSDINTIQGNSPDVRCDATAILKVDAPQDRGTGTGTLDVVNCGEVTSTPIFAP